MYWNLRYWITHFFLSSVVVSKSHNNIKITVHLAIRLDLLHISVMSGTELNRCHDCGDNPHPNRACSQRWREVHQGDEKPPDLSSRFQFRFPPGVIVNDDHVQLSSGMSLLEAAFSHPTQSVAPKDSSMLPPRRSSITASRVSSVPSDHSGSISSQDHGKGVRGAKYERNRVWVSGFYFYLHCSCHD